MRLKLQLPAKAGQFRISECEATRLLTLSANDFQTFLNWPQKELSWDAQPLYYEEDGKRVYRGVLILGEGRADGVFAYDAGEHFVYLPGARAVVDSILEQAVEKIIKEGTENTNEGSWCYYFSELYEQMGLVIEDGNGFDALLLEKLEQRPEAAEVALTDECFDICYYLNYCRNLSDEEIEGQIPLARQSELFRKSVSVFCDISCDEILSHETTLREIAGRLSAAGEWDTESIYESLTEVFGNNLSLDKQSKDDTKEEERNINIKQDQLDLLWQLEEFRKKHEHQAEPSDWAIRMCEAFVARSMGFTDRVQWTELLRQRGETLFIFDWKSGSVSDHVAQWCKENSRNWRYSHLGELQVAHGGEWRKVDYFCRDGRETRVYFPPESVQEQQLQALAEDPAIHVRDLLTLGLPDHDVYLVHATEDVGWVPAADLSRLTAQGKEEFSALLDAKVAAIHPGPYGVELMLDGVDPQLLVQYDETIANYSRAENTLGLFM